MFLTKIEISELTGYVSSAGQRRWLDIHKWVYECTRSGHIVISRAYAESRLSNAQPARVKPAMNLAAIRKTA